MPTLSRLISASFSTLPGFFFFILFLLSGWVGREYWWGMYPAVLLVLLISSSVFGFTLPPVFQRVRLRHPWMWILVQGLLAWTVALLLLGLLNMTPLCVGQNNGDGNNNFSMCMFITVLSGIVYTPFYLGILAVSSLIGHWVLKWQSGSESQS